MGKGKRPLKLENLLSSLPDSFQGWGRGQFKSLCRKSVMGEKRSLGRYWECSLTACPGLWGVSRETLGFSGLMLALAHGHSCKGGMYSLHCPDPHFSTLRALFCSRPLWQVSVLLRWMKCDRVPRTLGCRVSPTFHQLCDSGQVFLR